MLHLLATVVRRASHGAHFSDLDGNLHSSGVPEFQGEQKRTAFFQFAGKPHEHDVMPARL